MRGKVFIFIRRVLMTKRKSGMRLSAPKQVTWLVAVVLGLVGLLGNFGALAVFAQYAFWLMAAGWLLLVLATLLQGL
jgi:hypothetical protein